MVRKQSGISHLIFSMKQKLASILCPKMRKENVSISLLFQLVITEICNKKPTHPAEKNVSIFRVQF